MVILVFLVMLYVVVMVAYIAAKRRSSDVPARGPGSRRTPTSGTPTAVLGRTFVARPKKMDPAHSSEVASYWEAAKEANAAIANMKATRWMTEGDRRERQDIVVAALRDVARAARSYADALEADRLPPPR